MIAAVHLTANVEDIIITV